MTVIRPKSRYSEMGARVQGNLAAKKVGSQPVELVALSNDQQQRFFAGIPMETNTMVWPIRSSGSRCTTGFLGLMRESERLRLEMFSNGCIKMATGNDNTTTVSEVQDILDLFNLNENKGPKAVILKKEQTGRPYNVIALETEMQSINSGNVSESGERHSVCSCCYHGWE